MANPPPPDPDSDKRAGPRHRVMKGGRITYGDFVFVRDCTIRDISSSGARLSVPGAHEVPNEFYLVVTIDRLMYKARVIWRRDASLGVAFDGEPRNIMAETDPRLKQFQLVPTGTG